MANSSRVEKLAALLKREVSELLVNGVRDERIHQAMITITSVEVSGDLQHAKIFISLLSNLTITLFDRFEISENIEPYII